MSTQLEFDRPYWGRAPQRDMSKDLALQHGDVIQLGDTKIEVMLTPGHTLGTISLLFNVRQGRQTHRAFLWGGTAFNFGMRPERMSRIQSYIDATDKARQIALEQNIEVLFPTTMGTMKPSRNWPKYALSYQLKKIHSSLVRKRPTEL